MNASSANYVTSHTVTLVGLTPSTQYSFKAMSIDANGNIGQSTLSNFTTTNPVPDTTPPVLSTPVVTLVTDTLAIITWTTDEPATSQVKYSTTSGNLTSSTLQTTTHDLSHTVAVTGLTADTTYYFRAFSIDTSDNAANSAEYSFKTEKNPQFQHPPLTAITGISDPPVFLTDTKGVITFQTDQNAKCSINLGSQPGNYTNAPTAETFYNQDHSISLGSLVFSTTYYYKISCVDNLSTLLSSSEQSFTTLPVQVSNGEIVDHTPPVITALSSSAISTSSTTITWTTNKNSSSYVRFGTTDALGSLQGNDGVNASSANYVTSHTVTLVGLTPSTQYSFKAMSIDANGDIGQSTLSNFTTASSAIDTTPPVLSVPVAAVVTSAGAVITWTTDEPATAEVKYSTTSGNLTSSTGQTMTHDLSHAMILGGLTADTKYYFRAFSIDASGNAANSAEYSFTTEKDAQLQHPPLTAITGISNPPTVLTDTKAVISWKTDQGAKCAINSGAQSGNYLNAPVSETAYNSDHELTLGSLVFSTTYYYRISCMDNLSTNVSSSEQSFTTLPVQEVVDHSLPILSSVTASALTTTSVTVTWTTNKAASSYVRFGTTTALGSLQGDDSVNASSTNYVTSHTVTLVGLTPSTQYSFKAMSIDANGNIGQSTIAMFTTTTPIPDTVPPVLSVPVAALVTDTSAVITWTTDELATSQVRYSATSGNLSNTTVQTTTHDLSHSVIVTGLTADTTYYYKAFSSDASGNAANSAEYSFKTTKSAQFQHPPLSSITSVTDPPTFITDVQAVISFQTDQPAKCSINFGTAPGNYTSVPVVESYYNQDHSILLNSLVFSTKYYYQISCVDNLSTTVSSSEMNFTTLVTQVASGFVVDHTAPILSVVAVPAVTTASATVTWTTDEPSSSYVRFGTTTALGSLQGNDSVNASSANYVTSHTVTLVGLTPSTQYSFKAMSIDPSGNIGQSTIATFMTADIAADKTPPVISTPVVALITTTGAVITWTTDEPATAQVKYSAVSGNLSNATVQTTTHDLSHAVTLTGLTSNTLYYFEVFSVDVSGNAANSGEYSFTTEKDAQLQHPPLTAITSVSDPPTVLTDTKAVISFKTDQPAKCSIEYGTASKSYTEIPVSESGYNIDHSMGLTGLILSTRYYYTLTCVDNLNNIVSDNERLFTTLAKQGDAGTPQVIDVTPPSISGVSTGSVTGETAIITWKTDEKASSSVEYGLSGNGSGVVQQMAADSLVNLTKDNYSTDHTVSLSGLVPSMKYDFTVVSVDLAGNIGTSSQSSFSTSSPSTISNIKVVSSKIGEVTVTWNTNAAISSIVEYGLSANTYDQSKQDGALTQAHTMTLDNLKLNTTYHFRVKGRDKNGNYFASSDYVFSPKSPPQLKNITVEVISESEAKVTFATDIVTDAVVAYTNVVDASDTGSQGKPALTQSHEIVLKNLTSGATYKATIHARDEFGNETIQDTKNFTTQQDVTPPTIDYVKTDSALTQDGKVQAIISWKTNELATTSVAYRESQKGVEQTVAMDADAYASDHVLVFTTFKPGSAYYFKVKSTDKAGNEAVSKDYIFLTPKSSEDVVQMIINNFKDIFSWTKI